ncbi:hypothetical protein [Helicobacter sp. 23-1045]
MRFFGEFLRKRMRFCELCENLMDCHDSASQNLAMTENHARFCDLCENAESASKIAESN